MNFSRRNRLKTISEMWKETSFRLGLENAGEVQKSEMEKAYYAAIGDFIYESTRKDEMSDEEVDSWALSLMRECGEFWKTQR